MTFNRLLEFLTNTNYNTFIALDCNSADAIGIVIPNTDPDYKLLKSRIEHTNLKEIRYILDKFNKLFKFVLRQHFFLSRNTDEELWDRSYCMVCNRYHVHMHDLFGVHYRGLTSEHFGYYDNIKKEVKRICNQILGLYPKLFKKLYTEDNDFRQNISKYEIGTEMDMFILGFNHPYDSIKYVRNTLCF